VIVDEGKEKHLSFLIGVSRIGEIGAVHGIALPEVAEVGSFEAPIGLGALLAEELSRGSIAEGQVAAECTGRDGLLWDGIGLVEGEDVDDGAGGAVRLLALERLSAIEGLV
jgi:hypothetical protein